MFINVVNYHILLIDCDNLLLKFIQYMLDVMSSISKPVGRIVRLQLLQGPVERKTRANSNQIIVGLTRLKVFSQLRPTRISFSLVLRFSMVPSSLNFIFEDPLGANYVGVGWLRYKDPCWVLSCQAFKFCLHCIFPF